MKAKEVIDKIRKVYETTMVGIAEKTMVDKNVFYRVMRANKPFSNLLMEKLEEYYPDAFQPELEDDWGDVAKALSNNDEAPKPEIVGEPVPFIGDGTEEGTKIFEGENKDARFQLDEEPRKKLKRPNPPMWNVRCPENCYFAKVLVKDYKLLKPRCPMCQSEMLNKEDRQKIKAGIEL